VGINYILSRKATKECLTSGMILTDLTADNMKNGDSEHYVKERSEKFDTANMNVRKFHDYLST
jgi:hypothetical protein